MQSSREKLAIIGGTGLTQWAELDVVSQRRVETELGVTSGELVEGNLGGQSVYFLPRHGHPHSVAPHKINYRANMLALYNLGVSRVIAVNAVGGISDHLMDGDICIPDNIVDYTYGRDHTYFDGDFRPLDHVDFSYPYDTTLRDQLIQSAEKGKVKVVDGGVYAATQGPRLESAAEIIRLERDGCDVVGMTGMPEAALARELGISYVSLCLVVNKAAGKSQKEITLDDIHRVLASGIDQVKRIILECVVNHFKA